MTRTFITRKIHASLIASAALLLFVPGLAAAQQAALGLRDTASLFARFGDAGGPVNLVIAGQGGAVAETVLSQTATNSMTSPSGLDPCG